MLLLKKKKKDIHNPPKKATDKKKKKNAHDDPKRTLCHFIVTLRCPHTYTMTQHNTICHSRSHCVTPTLCNTTTDILNVLTQRNTLYHGISQYNKLCHTAINDTTNKSHSHIIMRHTYTHCNALN